MAAHKDQRQIAVMDVRLQQTMPKDFCLRDEFWRDLSAGGRHFKSLEVSNTDPSDELTPAQEQQFCALLRAAMLTWKEQAGFLVWPLRQMSYSWPYAAYDEPPRCNPFWEMDLPRHTSNMFFAVFRLRLSPSSGSHFNILCQRSLSPEEAAAVSALTSGSRPDHKKPPSLPAGTAHTWQHQHHTAE
ncbi:hypothetical protein WJX73_002716 [Symbiochloris irregularis]|uniref:Uncharacterized protein n=1 Tax=Symbiochloris irregularis TaxID=706552 RepID=A0AAW1PT10_9CHLO